jgi:BRCT domain type II-containing protein
MRDEDIFSRTVEIRRLTSSFKAHLAAKAARAAGPKNPGSKEIPVGKPNCLAGLTFVFTGELESLGRDDAAELVKRYSG